MKTKTPSKCALRVFAVAAAALFAIGELSGSGPMLLGGGEAHAVIGRPLTPMSYAGVARRTSRRTTRRAYAAGAYGGYYGGYGGYYGGYAPPPAAPYAPSAAVVTTLPSGCVRLPGSTVMYQCGTTHYQPSFEGPTVVYQVVR